MPNLASNRILATLKPKTIYPLHQILTRMPIIIFSHLISQGNNQSILNRHQFFNNSSHCPNKLIIANTYTLIIIELIALISSIRKSFALTVSTIVPITTLLGLITLIIAPFGLAIIVSTLALVAVITIAIIVTVS
jgi:hypothetical protein